MLCTPLRLTIDYLFGSDELSQFSKLAQKPRDDVYFREFAKVFSANRTYPLEYCFWLPYSLREDFTLLKKLTLQTKEIETVALEAIQKGFSCQVLEQVSGQVLDLPATFEAYTTILDSDCSICAEAFSMDDFVEQKIHRTACNHFFHAGMPCLAKWIKIQSICPICRNPLTFEEESKKWMAYLKKIDKAICEKFPEDMREDSRLALQLQESFSSSMKSSSTSSKSSYSKEESKSSS